MRSEPVDATPSNAAHPSAETAATDDRFRMLYRDRLAAMTRLAHLITGSNAVAEDLVHDAYLKVRPRLATIDAPEAYLRKTVVNECRMWLRHRAVEDRHSTVPLLSEDDPLPADAEGLWTALDNLTPRRRTALVLRFYEDLTVEGVAEAMGCRVGTAKSLIHRGLASLREVLPDDG